MKHLIALILVAFSLCACAQDTPDIKLWAETGVVIDTRTVEEWNDGHIDGATLIPYDQIADQIGNVTSDKDEPILLYCRSGSRAGIAEKTLKKLGYTNVVNLGGMSSAERALSSE